MKKATYGRNWYCSLYLSPKREEEKAVKIAYKAYCFRIIKNSLGKVI
jgi:hypothetical protein